MRRCICLLIGSGIPPSPDLSRAINRADGTASVAVSSSICHALEPCLSSRGAGHRRDWGNRRDWHPSVVI